MRYTDEQKQEFFQLVAQGLSGKESAMQVGVPESAATVTASRWLKKARDSFPRKARKELEERIEERVKEKMVEVETAVVEEIGDQLAEYYVNALARDEKHKAEVITSLMNTVKADPLDIWDVDDDGKLRIKSLDKIPQHIRKLIDKVDVSEKKYVNKRGDEVTIQSVKVQMVSKVKALELLGRYYALWAEEDKPSTNNQNIFQLVMNMSPQQVDEWIRTNRLPEGVNAGT
jgi:phage terminase small subunit